MDMDCESKLAAVVLEKNAVVNDAGTVAVENGYRVTIASLPPPTAIPVSGKRFVFGNHGRLNYVGPCRDTRRRDQEGLVPVFTLSPTNGLVVHREDLFANSTRLA